MGVRNQPPPCCVLEQDTVLPENTGNTQEAVAPFRPDMTEKLLTWTLSLNTNKQTFGTSLAASFVHYKDFVFVFLSVVGCLIFAMFMSGLVHRVCVTTW